MRKNGECGFGKSGWGRFSKLMVGHEDPTLPLGRVWFAILGSGKETKPALKVESDVWERFHRI